METIATQLDRKFRNAIRAAFALDADPLIAPSQNDKFGDYQSNAAMGLAKTLSAGGVASATLSPPQKTNPRQVAEQIKQNLDLGELASEISIAGPGFINVKLNPAWLEKTLGEIAKDDRLGIPKTPNPQTVVVDYSGPNIAKELHVGHLRSTIIGDAIARVLGEQGLGHNVIRQNHVGDWGTQFGMLITLLYSAGLQQPIGPDGPQRVEDPSNLRVDDLEDFYRAAKQKFDANPAFQDESRKAVVKLQAGEQRELKLWRLIVEETRRHYQPIYQRLGVLLKKEDERGESSYNPMLPSVVADLKRKGLAVESEGATVVLVEGYENPLIIEKTGGGYLYGTTDLAAVRYRASELGAKRILYFTDSRQSQHFAQVFAVAKKAGWTDDASLEHAPFGTMLGEDGKPFKTRTGGVVKLADLLDEAEQRAFNLVTEKNPELPEAQRRDIAKAIGIGGVKYSDLSKDRVSDYVFSFDKMLALDGNTAPYLQYAYARIRSIFRRAAERGIAQAGDSISLQSPFELALAKHILRLGEVLEVVARELKPHHLTSYLYDLATRFSGFFENCSVLQSEEPTRSSRLALCAVTARTLALALDLLGIAHPEQM